MNDKTYGYCAVIGVDGMGNFNRFADTPNMDRIFKNGATTDFALSMDPTISAQNWGAMLLGVSPNVHGLTNGMISQYEYTNREFPSLFTRIRRVYPDAYLTSVCNWDPINHGLIEHDINADLATAENDEKLQPMILERIAKKPKFLFVQFDDVDGAGHGNDYGSPEHLKQIEISDGYIGEIYDAYEKAGIADDTLFIVIADHGGIRRGHGGYTDEEKYVFFGMAGKTVKHTDIKNAATVDIAATVLCAFGLDIPEYDIKGFSSQVPEGVFDGYDKKYVKAQPRHSDVKNAATPAFGSEKGLASFFDRDIIDLAMFFDNDLRDETGNCEFTEHGNVKFYSNGVNGSCAEFGMTGCASTETLKTGKNSFTIAVWLNVDRSINEDCVVCGNRDWWWQTRKENGFSLVLKNNDTVFSIGNGNDCESVVTPLPDEIESGWVHITSAFDMDKKELRVYTNFEHTRTFRFADEFILDVSGGTFYIGNDTRIKNNTVDFPNIFKMDDLFIFSGAFDDAQAARLAAYYER